MLDDIEEHFAAAGRHRRRAGMTQAALRHHFATRDELLFAFFASASAWFRGHVAVIFAMEAAPARDKLERCIGWHLEYMEAVDTVFWLESSAYWLRESRARRFRDDFYQWLIEQYAQLLAQMQPSLGPSEHQRKAFVLLTLVLGSWITHGRGSSIACTSTVPDRRQLIIDAAMDIAAQ